MGRIFMDAASGSLLCKLLTRAAILLFCLVAFAVHPVVAETAGTPPPPEKVNQLLDILSDPAVKAWIEQQKTAGGAAAPAPPAETDRLMLSSVLNAIKTHLQDVAAAVPRLPAQFDRALNILLVEFEETGLLYILALIVGFIGAGLGLDKLARRLLRPYLAWMKTLRIDAPRDRLKSLAARTLYALIMIAAFILGSAGMFLAFGWPPLLREIVLAYLTAAILTRVVLMLSRLVILPASLGLPNSFRYRVLPVSDESAEHWYKYVGINTAWFTFASATLGILATLGFDESGRYAIGAVAGLIQLALLLLAVWKRPETSGNDSRRFSHRALSWLLTGFFVLIWLLRASGSFTVFWMVFAAVALPSAIAAAKSAVYYVLRPPEEGSSGAPVAPVTIAVVDRGIRVMLILAAAYFLSWVWGLDFSGMVQGDSLRERLLRGALNATIIILAADFGWSVAKALIARKLGAEAATAPGEAVTPQQARLRTLLPIFQNVLLAVIVALAIMMTLSSLGIEIGPLIAGAGVAGVAIGFGAQTLVKDVISGMFYLLDDAFRVGEYIESGNHKGTVESFSLRSVKLRHHRGYLATVPFGELGSVRNMSRDWVIDKFNLVVGYDSDMEKVRKLIKKLGQELAADPEFAPHVIEPLKMQGIENYGDYGIEIRLKLMTKPGEQFPVRRKALVRLKQIFAENGIEIPVPTVQVRSQPAVPAEEAAAAALRSGLKPAPGKA